MKAELQESAQANEKANRAKDALVVYLNRLHRIWALDDDEFLNRIKFVAVQGSFRESHNILLAEIEREPESVFQLACEELMLNYKYATQIEFRDRIHSSLFCSLLQVMAQCAYITIRDAEGVIRHPQPDDQIGELFYHLMTLFTVPEDVYKILYAFTFHQSTIANEIKERHEVTLAFLNLYLPYLDNQRDIQPHHSHMEKIIQKLKFPVDTYYMYDEFLTEQEPLECFENAMHEEEAMERQEQARIRRKQQRGACETTMTRLVNSAKIATGEHANTICLCADVIFDLQTQQGSRIIELDCGHSGHFDCIRQHLLTKRVCPWCRRAHLCQEIQTCGKCQTHNAAD